MATTLIAVLERRYDATFVLMESLPQIRCWHSLQNQLSFCEHKPRAINLLRVTSRGLSAGVDNPLICINKVVAGRRIMGTPADNLQRVAPRRVYPPHR
jgi:hypothetical protein